jgi:hypothetical protein
MGIYYAKLLAFLTPALFLGCAISSTSYDLFALLDFRSFGLSLFWTFALLDFRSFGLSLLWAFALLDFLSSESFQTFLDTPAGLHGVRAFLGLPYYLLLTCNFNFPILDGMA